MQRTGLDKSGLTVTTAGGIHSVPLAEFALTGALYFQNTHVHDMLRLGRCRLPVTVATLVPGVILLAVPFLAALRLFANA